jgi:hypothetical protein
MIDRHKDDIPSWGQPKNTLNLGLVEGETTRSVSSSAVPIATETRTTFNSKSSRPSCLRYLGT